MSIWATGGGFGDIGAFLDLMTTTVTVVNPTTGATTRGLFGTATYDSTQARTYQAHIMERQAGNRDPEGISDAATVTAWIASTSTSAITRDSIVRLPDGSHPNMIDIAYPRDERGVHHTVCYFR